VKRRSVVCEKRGAARGGRAGEYCYSRWRPHVKKDFTHEMFTPPPDLHRKDIFMYYGQS